MDGTESIGLMGCPSQMGPQAPPVGLRRGEPMSQHPHIAPHSCKSGCWRRCQRSLGQHSHHCNVARTGKCLGTWKVGSATTESSARLSHGAPSRTCHPGTQHPPPCTFLRELSRAGHGAGTAPPTPVSSTAQGWPGCSLLPIPQEMSQTPLETPGLPRGGRGSGQCQGVELWGPGCASQGSLTA